MSDEITLDYHKEYSYNCLTAEEFKILQETHKIGDEFYSDCEECENFTIWGPTDRRCDCGNRRCYFTYNKFSKFGKYFFEILVD